MNKVRMLHEPLSLTGLIVGVAACIGVGTLFGGVIAAMWFTQSTRMPSVGVVPQRAEVVLVVQTATPANPLALQPAPQVLPNATTATTLEGARAYLRAGLQDAKVQVVLFEDGQCPYCKQLSAGPVRQLISDVVSTGQVALTYRHFPVLGQESQRLAAAMECAGKQGKFWPYHDLVFVDQQPENLGAITGNLLLTWASEVKLDIAAFETCLGSDDVQELIAADFRVGQSLRVQGTPTLFINGERLTGAVPYDILKAKVDEALRAAK